MTLSSIYLNKKYIYPISFGYNLFNNTVVSGNSIYKTDNLLKIVHKKTPFSRLLMMLYLV